MKLPAWTIIGLCCASLLAIGTASASAGTINVLWYTGGVGSDAGGTSGYVSDVNTLAGLAPSAPGGNTWNVTFWSGGAMPTGSFNVLVVASAEGPWSTNPNYTAIDNAGLTFDPGTQRVMLTGQDADWHYMDFPGGAPDSGSEGGSPALGFNGPEGFLLDSVNWAGSGTGMGLVALGQNGLGTCGAGATLSVGGGFTTTDCATNDVVIPGDVATNPVNTNLTSAGLSNWDTAAHVGFTGLSSAWEGINIDGGFPSGPGGSDATCSTATPDSGCEYVTIVSASSVGGGISGGGPAAVPEPTSMILLGTGALGLLARRRKNGR